MYSVHIIQAELDINPELILNKQTSIGVVLSWFYSFLFLIFSAVHFVHFEHAHDCIRKLVFDITQLKLHHRRVHTHCTMHIRSHSISNCHWRWQYSIISVLKPFRIYSISTANKIISKLKIRKCFWYDLILSSIRIVAFWWHWLFSKSLLVHLFVWWWHWFRLIWVDIFNDGFHTIRIVCLFVRLSSNRLDVDASIFDLKRVMNRFKNTQKYAHYHPNDG